MACLTQEISFQYLKQIDNEPVFLFTVIGNRMLQELNKPVTVLKGIGPEREKILAESGVRTLKDLLLCLPRRYSLRPEPDPLASFVESEQGAAFGEVKRSVVSGRGRRRNLRVTVEQDDLSVELVLFNRGYLKSRFKSGQKITFQGKVTQHEGTYQVLSPDYHLDGDPGQGFPGLIPRYSLPPGLFPRTFHRSIDEILKTLSEAKDWREVNGLPDRELMHWIKALSAIHRPDSLEETEAARRRIAYEEFFAFQLSLAKERAERERKQRARAGQRRIPSETDKVYLNCLPFELTRAQKEAVSEIKNDLASPTPMHRLLQGDVGSGKTVVALYPMLAAALSGGQAALMAPTEVLAGQHFSVLTRLLEPAGIKPVLVKAGLNARAVKTLLEDPSTRIVVGTHALIQERVGFKNLKVCVIDEQHKFGVRQRWHLKAKGTAPDVLVMTATPIPRSLALTLYGELDVTSIRTLPPGRLPVETKAVDSMEDETLRARLEEEIGTLGRAFFVCPLIHESEKMDLEAAVKLHRTLKTRYEPGCKVGLLHGAMGTGQKETALQDFREGRTPFLVTTVVVEVGVDVPEASTVVILDAWRFGLAQLHQIRGRVGRGVRPSLCFLVGEPSTEAGKRRIRILEGTNNGFKIAEEDLRMRGPGEAMGTRQHGLPPLRAGDYITDVDLMTAARDDARAFVSSGSRPPEGGFLFTHDVGEGTWIG
jgi:ATP-dependent DNA helicase RecG